MQNRVLIIEDDPDIAESLRICLKTDKVDTRVALTGEDGLIASLDRNEPPHAIVLDLLLPGMNGIELCRRLRKESNTRVTPIIFLTARTSDSDIRGCFDAGADDYIAKPFSMRTLLRRLEAVIARQEKKGIEPYDDGELRIDFDAKRVSRHQQPLQINGLDFALLATLASAPNKITTCQELVEKIWTSNECISDWAANVVADRLYAIVSVCGNVIEQVSEHGYSFVGLRKNQAELPVLQK